MKQDISIVDNTHNEVIDQIFKRHLSGREIVRTTNAMIGDCGGLKSFIELHGISDDMHKMLGDIISVQINEAVNRFGDMWFLYASFNDYMTKMYFKMNSRADYVKKRLEWNPNLSDLSYQVLTMFEKEKCFGDIRTELLNEISDSRYYKLCRGADKRMDDLWDGKEELTISNKIIHEFVMHYQKIMQFEKTQKIERESLASMYLRTVLHITDESDNIDDYSDDKKEVDGFEIAGKGFPGYLKNVMDPFKFAENLKKLMEGKKKMGYAALYEALLKLHLVDPIKNKLALYRSMKDFFGNVGDHSAFSGYLSDYSADGRREKLLKSNLIDQIEKEIIEIQKVEK